MKTITLSAVISITTSFDDYPKMQAISEVEKVIDDIKTEHYALRAERIVFLSEAQVPPHP